jgi:hypothetical protein
LVQAATTVFSNRDLEKEKKKDKPQEALIAALQMTPSDQVQTHGQRKHLQDSAPFVKGSIRGNTVPGSWWSWMHSHLSNDGSLGLPSRLL